MGIFRRGTHEVIAVPSPPREVHVSVWTDGQLVANTLVHATLTPEPRPDLVLTSTLLPENRLSFRLPGDVPYTWGAQLKLQGPESALISRVLLAPDLDVELPAPQSKAPGLVVDGQFFRTIGGAPYTIIGCSDFRLLKRWTMGEDPEPDTVLAQRRAVGFNDLRVFGLCQNMFQLRAERTLEYLHGFCSVIGKAGFTMELTFGDWALALPDLGEQREFLTEVYRILQRHPHVRLELVNEADQTPNRIDTAQHIRPIGLFASHGSNGSQVWPVRPTWDYETYHSNDAPEWWRKCGHEAMEIANDSKRPCVANENTRFPDKCWNLVYAADAARAAALLCAGSVFHSVRGKQSALWDGLELDAAITWAGAAASVPLEFQRGRYIRRDDLLRRELLRVYERRLDDGRGYIAEVRR